MKTEWETHQQYFECERVVKDLVVQQRGTGVVKLFGYMNDNNPVLMAEFTLEELKQDQLKKDSPYLDFVFLVQGALFFGPEPFSIIVKSKAESAAKWEIRSLHCKDAKLRLLSADELRKAYSVDSLTGEPITPPKDYTFCEFTPTPKMDPILIKS